MALIALRDGRMVLWEPTTDLICTCCREPLDRATVKQNTMECVNFVYDMDKRPDALSLGEYWYLHKRCSRIEDALLQGGASLFWGWHPIDWVLGLSTFMKRSIGDLGKHLRKRMPPGAYDRLYHQWMPAPTSKRPGKAARLTRPIPVQRTPQEMVGWLALRFEILKRDNYRCRVCGSAAADGEHVRLEVDHIVARVKGGKNVHSNLWTLCFDCNRGKGTKAL